jgi:DNA-binding beta-propeller fold protein YncE
MKRSGCGFRRGFAGCLTGCLVVVLLAWVALSGLGGGTSAASQITATTASDASLLQGGSSLRSPLVAPAVQSLNEGEAQQAAAAEQTRLDSPAAFRAREASRTEFEHLGAARAAQVARAAFPAVIERPAGGPPQLPAGDRLARYLAPNAARLALPGGKHAVVESMEPMAIKTSSAGRFTPVDLSLSEVGGVFESRQPLVGVLIPKRLNRGVQLPERGVSLTPVGSQGSPLTGSEGTVDGASVLYANTQTDTDTVVKPTTAGVEVDAMLRSIDSPRELFYRVTVPAGAKLVQNPRSGAVRVVSEGVGSAVVQPPAAHDAAGTEVPVSMSVKGHTLVLAVGDGSAEYQWPVDVDPEMKVKDETFAEKSNWKTQEHLEKHFVPEWEGHTLNLSASERYVDGEWVAAQYHTDRASKIYELEAHTKSHVVRGKATLEIFNGQGIENKELLGEKTNEVEKEKPLCVVSTTCPSSAGTEGNTAAYKIEALETGEPGEVLSGALWDAKVFIEQEKEPEAHFNTSTEILTTKGTSRANVLYGGTWLSPTQGAFEGYMSDPGLGVSLVGVSGPGVADEINLLADGDCSGVQCNEKEKTTVTYNPDMPDGEDKMEVYAEDPAGFFTYTNKTVKVDGTPPHNLEVSGWPKNREVSAASHALTIEATDGTTGTPSSGMKSIGVQVDGGAMSYVSGASCPSGPCTASGKWTLEAEGLTEGVHRLTVTATDNAGNVAAQPFTFDVRHGSPVAVGPGTVDPTTGQFKLSATDVSLAGAGGVSRVYESRNLTAGAGGPLGPQWAIGLGGSEGLTALPNGSVALGGSAGGVTTFARNEKGEFESPLGDGNLTIEPKEEAGKGITEYLLKDSKAGTTTTFKQPLGTEDTVPLFSDQFGGEAGELNRPVSDVVDSSGNLWVTDYANNRIMKFSPAGTPLAAYEGLGSESGQLLKPYGIAINKSTGNVYVTDQGNNRIAELNSSGVFVKAIGWGVSNGEAKLETCTTSCQAGIAGSGEGQFNLAAGVAIDSSGDIWVADYSNNRIQELNEEGSKVLHMFGSGGTGAGQFKEPAGVTFSGGNLYVTDQGNDRLQEFSTAGAFIKAVGWGVNSGGGEKLEVCTSSCKAGTAGSGNGEFNGPRGLATDPVTGNLYVSEIENDRVQELTAAGAFVTKFGSAGSGNGQFAQPMGVAASSSGGIYVTDYENARVQEWTRPMWMPTLIEGTPESGGSTAYAYKPVEEEGRTVIEPTEVLAPTPSGVTCVGAHGEVEVKYLKKGCRALTFEYALTTKESIGEKESEWGKYAGRLEKVSLVAYNPATKEIKESGIPVAEYAYDKQGRLRAEWDPRIETSTACGKTCSALKTTYGYDAEGHVTAVSSPGQEPWFLTYGMIGGDTYMGRLMSVTHPSAATALRLASGLAPVDSVKPKLSTTAPVEGTEVTVSAGTWSNDPGAYGYQWESCNSSGGACSAIAGAIDPGYTPRYSDEGHTLRVDVTATGSGGSGTEHTTASSVVPEKEFSPTYSLSIGSAGTEKGELKSPTYATIQSGSEERLFVSDTGNNRVEGFTTSGEWKQTIGSLKEPTGITTNASLAGGSHMWVANAGEQYVDLYEGGILKSGAKTNTTSLGGMTAVGTETTNDQYVASPKGNDIEEMLMNDEGNEYHNSSFGKAGSGNGEYKEPWAITWAPTLKWLLVADTGNNRVQALSSESYANQFGKAGTGAGEFKEPKGIAVDSKGNAWVVDTGNDRIEEFTYSSKTLKWEFDVEFGKKGTGHEEFEDPIGIAIDSSNNIYVVDSGNNRVVKLNPGKRPANNPPLPPAKPPSTGTSSVETIEYHVPVSGAGTGAPNLSKTEVEKWGQKDDPSEGMAIFPSSKPQGWPASTYEGATIDYMDEQGRTVNTYSPTGGVSTTEYNEANEVTRILSADNQKAALKETGKTAAASELLDTKDRYNGETKEEKEKEETEKEGKTELGARLLETRGPEHKVKVPSTSEPVEARAVTHYYYNEGAKEAEEKNKETYNLVTKTTGGVLLSGGEEEKLSKRETVTSYSGQEDLGWKLREPTSVTKEPSKQDLTSTTVYEKGTGNVIETMAPGSESSVAKYAYASVFGSWGHESGELNGERGVAINSSGDLWVADTYNDRIEEFSPEGKALLTVGKEGTGASGFKEPRAIAIDSSGNVWVSDFSNRRVQEFSSTGTFIKMFGWGVKDGKEEAEVCTSSCYAGNPGSGHGQFSDPYGLAFDSKGNLWVADTGGNRVEEFSSEGKYMAEFGSKGSAKGQLDEPRDVVFDSKGDIWVADSSNNRVQEFSTTTIGEALAVYGSGGSGPGQFDNPIALAFDSKGDLWVAEMGNSRLQELSSSGAYMQMFGSKGSGHGQFDEPGDLAFDSKGDIWVADRANNRMEEFAPGNQAAHDLRTIYYSTAANSEFKNCGEHPEWANLPCETLPKAQPGTNGLWELPETTVVSYNVWNEAEKTEEKFKGLNSEGKEETVTRTKIQSYDPAGRALTSEETTSPATDTAVPEVTNEYSIETGALEKQSAEISGKVKTITSKDNALGQLVEYTDAEGNVAKYIYEEGGDGHLVKVTEGKGEEAKSEETYSYNATTGLMEKLINTAVGMTTAEGTFTATYDVEGNMTDEVYPNGMCANTTYNSVGTATGVEYLKPKTCTESKPTVWFSDSVVPSIDGETLQQTSTLSKENYTYDNLGRLTETQETPAGKDCKSRLYGYDEESNRTSETTRESSTETCATEGGTTEIHSYDIANRLVDSGVEYETFGNTTKMPAADAGHEIVSTYYLDNQVATQKQNEQSFKYSYDPAGRMMEATSENETTKAKSTVITHYAGGGNALTWTSEGSEKWTRNIPGIDGALDAIQEAGKSPVLQLHDLQGNIVGTVGDSESETKLVSSYNSTEFGVPQPGLTPPKYAWLGAQGVSSEPSQGAGASNQSGASYVPQVARSLQIFPIIPPGAFPNGSGTGSPHVSEIPGYSTELFEKESAATMAEYQTKLAQEAAEALAALQKCRAEGGCGATPEYNPGDGPPCNEQKELCGTDPEKGYNTAQCHVWPSWGDLSAGLSNDVAVYGHFECAESDDSIHFELKICAVLNVRGGANLGCEKGVWHNLEAGEEYSFHEVWECTPGATYKAWVFGRFWGFAENGSATEWSDTAVDGRLNVCGEHIDPDTPQ